MQKEKTISKSLNNIEITEHYIIRVNGLEDLREALKRGRDNLTCWTRLGWQV